MSGGEGTFMVPTNYPDPHRQNVNSLPMGFAYGEGGSNDLVDLGHPVPPGNVHSTAKTATTITLAWNSKSESGGSYNLYDGATKLGSTRNATATISGLTTATDYSLSVSYVDDAGTESSKSAVVAVTTS